MDQAEGRLGAEDGLDEDFRLLVEAVREAGELALTYFGRGIQSKRKADNTEVSEADLAADSLLRERLASVHPDYGWLSEESADNGDRLTARRVWIVDPIDGTYAFLRGIAEWAVAAALVEDGQPVLSAVFNPATGEMFTARRGAGCFLNGTTRLKVHNRAGLENSRVITRESLLTRDIWHEPWPDLQLHWINSIAYRLALLSMNRVDAVLEITAKSEWDLAAPALLVQEAGGRISAADGSAYRFNNPVPRLGGLVAASPQLHELLIARTQKVQKA